MPWHKFGGTNHTAGFRAERASLAGSWRFRADIHGVGPHALAVQEGDQAPDARVKRSAFPLVGQFDRVVFFLHTTGTVSLNRVHWACRGAGTTRAHLHAADKRGMNFLVLHG